MLSPSGLAELNSWFSGSDSAALRRPRAIPLWAEGICKWREIIPSPRATEKLVQSGSGSGKLHFGSNYIGEERDLLAQTREIEIGGRSNHVAHGFVVKSAGKRASTHLIHWNR
jgi:hypothetical protein